MFLTNTSTWYIERIVWLVAGIFILASLVLTHYHSGYWMILTTIVGLNLIILSLTGFCPMTVILGKLGVPAKCDR